MGVLRKNRLAPRLVLGAFILIATVYSVVVPPFETPDEIWHFAFIYHLATGQGLPVVEPDTEAIWRQQGVQAPAYYLVAAALTAWVDQSDFPQLYRRANPHRAIGRPLAQSNRNYLIHHGDEAWPWQRSVLALHIARLFSIALGALTLWALYRALTLILDERSALLGMAAFAAIPQFVFISAAASNDNAVNALAALVLWRLVSLLVQNDSPTRRSFFILGGLLGAALLSKLSALGLAGPAGTTVIWLAWRERAWRVLWQAALWIGLPALAIVGWWYARNWLLYGDPLAWNIWQENILLRVKAANWRAILSELGSLERSFWGLFGWLNLAYPEPVYGFFRGLELFLGVGLLATGARGLFWRRRRGELRARQWWGIAILLLWLLLLTLSWLRFMRIAPAGQGRYFFPAAPTLALVLALGLRAWGNWMLAWLVVLSIWALNVVTPFWIIHPAYQPPPAQAHLAKTLTPLHATLGDELAILGVEASPAQLTPGDEAVVAVAWQAIRQTPTDYSVFVHLIDEDGLIVAQLDTMPGGGLWPTSRWAAGEVRVERYFLRVPPLAYTPNRARWAVGLYNHQAEEGRQRLPVLLQPLQTAASLDMVVKDQSLRFGQVTLEQQPGAIPNPIAVDFHDNVTLAGYSLSARRLQAGDTLTVTLYWQARGPVTQKYIAFAHLLDENYQMYGGHDDEPPVAATAWQPATMVVDTHTILVAADAPPGFYQVELGLYTKPRFRRLALLAAEGAEGADRVLLGPLEIVR